MGLFDKIVKNAVGDALGGALGDALEKATGVDINQDGKQGGADVFGVPQGSQSSQASQSAQPAAQPAPAARPAPAAASGTGLNNHAEFAALLAEKFADYQVQEFAPVSVFGGEGKPYDFLLSKDGSPVIALMLTEGNRYRGKDFVGAKAASEAAGVPFVNFFLRLPNERGYVINRIKTTLGLL
jgi:hypothetical protein